MSIEIGDNLTGSFGYAKEKIVGNIGNWILLMILTIIPIVNFIAIGTYLKIFRGEDPKVADIGKSFVDGLLAFIIAVIYMIIPTIIALILGGGTLLAAGLTGSAASFVAASIGGFICLIIYILFVLIMIPAVINFVRNGFGAAFHFSEIFGMIGKVGWLNYILCIIVVGIIFGIFGLLGRIPFVGWLIMIIIYPFLVVWTSKFLANLFE